MSAEMVREIAFVDKDRIMDPAALAFAVEAVRVQLHEHFWPAWADYLPVKRPLEVVGYTDTTHLEPGSFAPILIMRSLGDPGTRGDHGGIGITDEAWGRSQPDPVVMSHEALELGGDPFGDRWVKMANGLVTALEVADAVENDTYLITATVGGASRDVAVSNFLYPAWFGEGLGKLDHLGLCKAPGDNRGYLIIQDADGATRNVFASTATTDYRERVEAKLEDPRSRTYQRHRSQDRRLVSFP